MVIFSCDGCNEVLKKSQVDAHANRCRNCYAVSCVDCLVSFPGDDYRAHTSCMTEAERYEKKAPSAKAAEKKVTPQQHWMNAIGSAVDRAPAHLRNYVRTMSQLDNVPRKEKQFRNFTANSLNLRGNQKDSIVSAIWNLLKEERERQRPAAAADAKAAATESSSSEAAPSSSADSSAPRTSNESRASAEEPSQLVAVQSTSNDIKHSGDRSKEGSTSNGKREEAKEESPEKNGKKKKKDVGSSSATKKSVKKAIRSVLKQSRKGAVPLKALRKAVRAQLQLPKSDTKKYVAEIVNKNGKKSSSFEVAHDGKTIRLKS